MEKTVVVYKSKSGYTKAYAQWIAEELKCELKENNHLNLEDIKDYDTIIYGGGLYAVGINGIDLIKKNIQALDGKKIVVWATGSNPGRKEEMEQVWNYNFTKEQRSKIQTFYLRGGFDYTKLNAGDKILMKMLKMKLMAKKVRTEDEDGMLKAYDIAEYHCKKENIKDLITYVKE